jgi:hypothetical protein
MTYEWFSMLLRNVIKLPLTFHFHTSTFCALENWKRQFLHRYSLSNRSKATYNFIKFYKNYSLTSTAQYVVAQFDQKVLRSRISAQPSLPPRMSGHTACIVHGTYVHLSHVYTALNQTARRPHMSWFKTSTTRVAISCGSTVLRSRSFNNKRRCSTKLRVYGTKSNSLASTHVMLQDSTTRIAISCRNNVLRSRSFYNKRRCSTKLMGNLVTAGSWEQGAGGPKWQKAREGWLYCVMRVPKLILRSKCCRNGKIK